MTERLEKIFSVIPVCETFADVACDHGYIAMAMLKSGKCSKVIVSDISGKSLSKAEDLLKDFVRDGRVQSIVADGFDGLPHVDCALIAGLGGEEIIKILKRRTDLPQKLVLQPMKHCDKVRECAVSLGYKIIYDRVFKSGIIYYNLISLERGEDSLTEEEKVLGRTNVLFPEEDFISMAKYEYGKIIRFIEGGADGEKKEQLLKKAEMLGKYVDR